MAYHKATGNQLVLDTACRLADCLDRHFGPEKDKIHGYDGHEEIELALFRLYETVGNKRYLELGKYFLYQRGKDPDFFRKQCQADKDKSVFIEGMEGFKDSYYQNHKPVLEQETAEGHAVRVMYMCTGMTMLARLKNDEKMRQAARGPLVYCAESIDNGEGLERIRLMDGMAIPQMIYNPKAKGAAAAVPFAFMSNFTRKLQLLTQGV